MTGRQVEVWADRHALSEKPKDLQMVSPGGTRSQHDCGLR